MPPSPDYFGLVIIIAVLSMILLRYSPTIAVGFGLPLQFLVTYIHTYIKALLKR